MNALSKPLPLGLTLLIVFALLLSSALVVKPVIAADTIMVINLADSGAGSLRQAIEDISLNGTITFDPSLSGQITLSSPLAINENLTIDGSAMAEPITISGNDNIRVFEVSSSVTDAILKSLTISNGNSSNDPGASGGAIKNIGHLTLINCTFYDHQTDGNGGAIENFSESTLIVENSRFYHNQSKYHGGAIANYGTMIISNSIFSDNHSTDLNGGGIANFADLEISASSFSDNSAYVLGGGLYNTSVGNLTLITSTLSGNRTVHNYMPSGGGVYNAGNLSMINSTLSENIVEGMLAVGGGIYNSGSLMLTNSTLSGNIAKGDNAYGGGIINHGSMKYTHTIITDSFGGNCVNQGTIHPDSTHNMVRYSNCNVMTNLAGDPLLGPLADNGGPTLTHALLPGSPAIDAGSNAHCPGSDQRGVSRPLDGSGDGFAHCDIGAFELAPYHLVVTNTSDNEIGSLRKAIADIQPGGRITFSPSLSGQTITLVSPLQIDKNLAVDGSGLAVPITISGNNAVGVFNVGPTVEDAILVSLTIIHGNREAGGGIFNMGVLTVTNCTVFENNAQEDGGGIFNMGELTIISSTLSGNNATDGGGGIYNLGFLDVVNSTLSGNTADETGGGVRNDGTLNLNNAILSRNTTGGSGGGIYTIQTLNMTNSTLSENSAYEGGGIYNLLNLEITKSTLSGNTAREDGGGIVNVGSLTITNSTLSGNHAKRGGGILNDDSLTLRNVTLYGNAASASNGGGVINLDDSILYFFNTIIAYSTGGDCVKAGSTTLDGTHNLVEDGSCQVDDGSNLSGDPMLGPLANNGGPTLTHAILLSDSPAVDAGDPGTCAASPVNNLDQRGYYRPFDGNKSGEAVCDIGAFELHDFIIFLPLILR